MREMQYRPRVVPEWSPNGSQVFRRVCACRLMGHGCETTALIMVSSKASVLAKEIRLEYYLRSQRLSESPATTEAVSGRRIREGHRELDLLRPIFTLDLDPRHALAGALS